MPFTAVRDQSSHKFGASEPIELGVVPQGEYEVIYVGRGGSLPVMALCRDDFVEHCTNSSFDLQFSLDGCVDSFEVLSGGLTAHQALADATRWRDYFVRSGFSPTMQQPGFSVGCYDKHSACETLEALGGATTAEEAEQRLLASAPNFNGLDGMNVYVGRDADGVDVSIGVQAIRADTLAKALSPAAASYESVYAARLNVSHLLAKCPTSAHDAATRPKP